MDVDWGQIDVGCGLLRRFLALYLAREFVEGLGIRANGACTVRAWIVLLWQISEAR